MGDNLNTSHPNMGNLLRYLGLGWFMTSYLWFMISLQDCYCWVPPSHLHLGRQFTRFQINTHTQNTNLPFAIQGVAFMQFPLNSSSTLCSVHTEGSRLISWAFPSLDIRYKWFSMVTICEKTKLTARTASGYQRSVYRHLWLVHNAVAEWCWWRHLAVVDWRLDKQREKRISSKKTNKKKPNTFIDEN